VVRWLSLLLLVGCAKRTPPVAAPEEAPPEATLADVPAPENPSDAPAELPLVERPLLLWRVTKDDKVSHLMGTCHLPLPLTDFIPDPTIIDQARVTMVEVDMATVHPVDALRLIWSEGSVYERMGRERFAELSRTVGPTLPAPLLDRMKDWAIVGAAAIQSVQPLSQPFDGTHPPLDQAVSQRAKEAGVPVRTVETLQEQGDMMEALDLDITEETTAEDEEAAAKVVDDMARLCLRGDLSGAASFTVEASPMNAQIFEARNLAWYPTVAEEVAQGGAFIAVGAGHMAGETGLVQQLKADGYEVERLSGEVREHPLPDNAAVPDPPEGLVSEADMENLLNGTAKVLCADDQLTRQCLAPDAAVCDAQVRSGLMHCVDQSVTQLTEMARFTDPMAAQQLVGCALSAMVSEALVKDSLPDTPLCASMRPPAP